MGGVLEPRFQPHLIARTTNYRDAHRADAAALGLLFQEHRCRLLAMIGRRMDPAMAKRVGAEDILSDVFLETARRWADFASGGMSPLGLLFRITRDHLIETWRFHTRVGRDVGRELPWPERSSDELADSLTTPSQALRRKELVQQVRDALAEMQPIDREILELRHLDRLAYAEIAAALDISEEAAMKRHSRALRRFGRIAPD